MILAQIPMPELPRQPLRISLDQVGKQYYRRWLFRDLSLDLRTSDSLALVGHNGSGKSTLLRMIAGQLSPSAGNVAYWQAERKVPAAEMYRYLSWSAPYVSLLPELNLREQYRLQARFKPMMLEEEEFLEQLGLEEDANKALRFYSSGMLQRAKVGLALFADVPVLLLDEPTSNMDTENARKILDLLHRYRQHKILVLASNLVREYGEFSHQIHLGAKSA